MAARKKKIWFGFLEAGVKGSPVVRDAELATGDPKTVYLFNFMKGKILEYRRDIVEVKLRELAAEELAMIPELRKAYKTGPGELRTPADKIPSAGVSGQTGAGRGRDSRLR